MGKRSSARHGPYRSNDRRIVDRCGGILAVGAAAAQGLDRAEGSDEGRVVGSIRVPRKPKRPPSVRRSKPVKKTLDIADILAAEAERFEREKDRPYKRPFGRPP